MNTIGLVWTHLSKVLEDYANEFVQYLKQSYISDDRWEHLAEDTLIQSVKYIIPDSDGVDYSVSISLHPYWRYVEFGRGPGKFPPVSAMTSYVQLKPVLKRPYKGKLPTDNQLAFLIGRKIAREGTEGTYNFEHTCKVMNEKYDGLISEAISQDLNGVVDNVFSKYFK